MSYKIQASFTAGELDPVLHERTTLAKYKTGLKTARNVVVGKTGRLISRGGRKHVIKTKLSDRRVIIHPISHIATYLEWGHLYVRVYTMGGVLIGDYAHAFTEDDLDDIRFTDITLPGPSHRVLISKDGSTNILLNVDSGGGFIAAGYFNPVTRPPYTSSLAIPTVTTTGYLVEYAVTTVINGVESDFQETSAGAPKLALAAAETNTVRVIFSAGSWVIRDEISEMRVYRRPLNAGAYGYIGSSSAQTNVANALHMDFSDVFGAEADFAHSPPTMNFQVTGKVGTPALPINISSKTGEVYQQRLILAVGVDIFSSRPGFPLDFLRDYPLDADSSLSFKAGSKGFAEVFHMIDHDGLVAFTSEGVFVNTGTMNETNLGMDKKGNWIADPNVPPISVPGGVLFIDSLTNTVRQLQFSEEYRAYTGVEVSIFSDHLFKGRKVRAWSFQEGELPLLWVVFKDGDYATFTYEREHQMKSWTRHDSGQNIEWVASTTSGVDTSVAPFDARVPGETIVVTNKGGERYIEFAVPRFIPLDIAEADSEADMGEHIAAMDAMVSWSHLINDDLTDDDMTLAPVTPGVWDGDLDLTIVDDAIFTDPGIGEVGTIFRHFHPVDKSTVELEVITRTDDNTLVVTPSAEFPSAYATNPRLYEAVATFTGLDHLDGESVSVMVDGSVVSSPNNDIQNYPVSTPAAGSLTLPNSELGAIVHIGRPYTMDMETLDLDTVEQRPTKIESVTVNKLYIQTQDSRGLYVGNTFPDDDKVDGMEEIDQYFVDHEDVDPVIANRFDQPKDHRYEVTPAGDWIAQGRVCIRQVDPLHFEILSIIPDVDDQRR